MFTFYQQSPYIYIITWRESTSLFWYVLYTVTANLGCLLDYICKQLKPGELGSPVKDFSDCIIWGENFHPKSGPHIFVAAHIKRHRGKKLLLFYLLAYLSLASSFIPKFRDNIHRWEKNVSSGSGSSHSEWLLTVTAIYL